MAEFVAELYVARADAAGAARNAEGARRAAEELGVRYVRAIFMPEDETCFLIYEAASAEAVREAVARASLPVARVVASVATDGAHETPNTHRHEGGMR